MAIFILPRMNSLSAAGGAQIRDFENERSKRAYNGQAPSLDSKFYIAPHEQFISGRSPSEKQETTKAVDFETRLQFLVKFRSSKWPCE